MRTAFRWPLPTASARCSLPTAAAIAGTIHLAAAFALAPWVGATLGLPRTAAKIAELHTSPVYVSLAQDAGRRAALWDLPNDATIPPTSLAGADPQAGLLDTVRVKAEAPLRANHDAFALSYLAEVLRSHDMQVVHWRLSPDGGSVARRSRHQAATAASASPLLGTSLLHYLQTWFVRWFSPQDTTTPATSARSGTPGTPGTSGTTAARGENAPGTDSATPSRAGIQDAPLTPVLLWIPTSSTVADWRPSSRVAVVTAAERWNAIGLPIRFVPTTDSASADVVVQWTDHFAENISGRTRWVRDDAGHIEFAGVTIATHHRDGSDLSADDLRVISLHELGHAIGLGHTTRMESVMRSTVLTRDLAAADSVTARALYALPVGPRPSSR